MIPADRCSHCGHELTLPPTPWHVTDPLCVCDAKGNILAYVDRGQGAARRIANLMAAAPEMLSALRECSATLGCADDPDMRLRVRGAMARAEGP